jgi:hypothetical protein
MVDLLIKVDYFVKKVNNGCNTKSSYSKLVSTRRSTVLSFPLQLFRPIDPWLTDIWLNVITVVESPVTHIKLLSEWHWHLFQRLVRLDTISDWPWWVSWQHFYSQSMPTRIFTGNTVLLVNILLRPATPWQQWNSFVFHCWPSKEQVHEERVGIADLCLSINRCRTIRYDVHLPVRQKLNLST